MPSQTLENLVSVHRKFIDKQLALDLTRGKPSAEQLDLSNQMLGSLDATLASARNTEQVDLRNYGLLSGMSDAKIWFAKLLGVEIDDATQNIFAGGNSSLSLMQLTLWLAHFFGIKESDQSWQAEAVSSGQNIKMLCPVPGYDRHFSLCEHLGIEMIPVKLTGNGPDMDQVESLVKNDPMIKGIWCVPRFANPTGEVYSASNVDRIARLPKLAGKNFYIFWDNAYAVHSISSDAAQLENINPHIKAAGTESSVLQFASTSKITFAGAGMSALASSANNIKGFVKQFGYTSIGPDKLNQLRHLLLLPDIESVEEHMKKHAAIISPKFELVESMLSTELGGGNYGTWTKPHGGYFVSFDTLSGLATRVIDLAAEAGVKLTPAGSTFPNKKDPNDSNIRLAPTYPNLVDLESALEVFINCVKIATLENP